MHFIRNFIRNLCINRDHLNYSSVKREELIVPVPLLTVSKVGMQILTQSRQFSSKSVRGHHLQRCQLY